MLMQSSCGAAALALAALACADGGPPPESPTDSTAAIESTAVTTDSVRLWYRVVGSGPQVVMVPR